MAILLCFGRLGPPRNKLCRPPRVRNGQLPDRAIRFAIHFAVGPFLRGPLIVLAILAPIGVGNTGCVDHKSPPVPANITIAATDASANVTTIQTSPTISLERPGVIGSIYVEVDPTADFERVAYTIGSHDIVGELNRRGDYGLTFIPDYARRRVVISWMAALSPQDLQALREYLSSQPGVLRIQDGT